MEDIRDIIFRDILEQEFQALLIPEKDGAGKIRDSAYPELREAVKPLLNMFIHILDARRHQNTNPKRNQSNTKRTHPQQSYRHNCHQNMENMEKMYNVNMNNLNSMLY